MPSVNSSDVTSRSNYWKPALETETRLDEQGHARDNDVGSNAPFTELAALASANTAPSTAAQTPMSFVLAFAKAVPRSVTSKAAATMTETFEKGGGGGRDDDVDTAATGTETKVGDPTARDQDIDLVGYAPIGGR